MHTDSLINPRAGAVETQIRFLSSNHPDVARARAQVEASDGGRDFLERAYPKLAALHHWFIKNRTRPDGLPFWKQERQQGRHIRTCIPSSPRPLREHPS